MAFKRVKLAVTTFRVEVVTHVYLNFAGNVPAEFAFGVVPVTGIAFVKSLEQTVFTVNFAFRGFLKDCIWLTRRE
jgi:hypothetical protein